MAVHGQKAVRAWSCCLAIVGLSFGRLLAGQGALSVPAKVLADLGALPAFALQDQDDRSFGTQDLKDKVWVAYFGYSTCSGTCPMIAQKVRLLQEAVSAGQKGFALVFITLDPAKDQPRQLRRYAERLGARPGLWHFLTGSKEAVRQVVKLGFGANAEPGVECVGPMGHYQFLHGTEMVLVDRRGHVRGRFDGLLHAEFDALKRGMTALLQEPS